MCQRRPCPSRESRATWSRWVFRSDSRAIPCRHDQDFGRELHPKRIARLFGAAAMLVASGMTTRGVTRPNPVVSSETRRAVSRSIRVSDDKDLLDLAGRIPVYSPGELLGFIGKAGDY